MMTALPLESRQDRQRRAIVRAFDDEDLARATALAWAHFVEFPDDEIVQARLDAAE